MNAAQMLEMLGIDVRANIKRLEEEMDKASVLEESKCLLRVAWKMDSDPPLLTAVLLAMHLADTHDCLEAAEFVLAATKYKEILARAVDSFVVRTEGFAKPRPADLRSEYDGALVEAQALVDRIKAKQDLANEVASSNDTAEADIG